MKKNVKALALFSGGLDSALAIKLIKNQGIEVIALNFVSHFFGGKNEKAEAMAKQLGVQLEYVDFSQKHIEMMKNPVYGRGKNMNPCIDCHALMFKFAGELLEKYDADFLISGEVLGQRPMSQNYQALEKVKGLSKLEEVIIRPLSAKLLPPSKPEIDGLVDREQLLDISGRSRKRQIEIAEQMGLVDYPTPAGGCLLTDPGYSKRLKLIEQDGFLEEENSKIFHLLKKGRFFRFAEGRYLFVGRTKEDNDEIVKYKEIGSMFIRGKGVGGPYILGYGELLETEKEFAKNLFSRYCKFKGEQPIEIFLNEKPLHVDIIDKDKTEEEIKKYQITME
ncbi:7-cyano-7-deazaguanine synthase [Fusobacterium sp.]|uniref:7-cyano-7-deazaguanine synthase n=1 Tax=Fusobacterium sp. TaxID=68766 RepID=UPI002637D41C|nr:7-cyano-7-deazaguanine synthase [Fusobacterium sp.]